MLPLLDMVSYYPYDPEDYSFVAFRRRRRWPARCVVLVYPHLEVVSPVEAHHILTDRKLAVNLFE